MKDLDVDDTRQRCEALQTDFLANRALIIAANRGPVTFETAEDKSLRFQRGEGGLVTALLGLCRHTDVTWIACAQTEADATWREGSVVLSDYGSAIRVQFLSPETSAYDGYYNVIANPLLWFLQHSMWDVPRAPAGIRFHVSTQMWQQNDDGGSLRAVRNLAYRTNGTVLKNELGLEREAYLIEFVVEGGDDVAIHLNIRGDLQLNGEPAPFSETLAAAERRWQDWFARVPPVAERYRDQYYYAWWVMSSNLVTPLGHVTHEAMMPSKVQYVGIWNWDACLHSLAFRYVDPVLARNQLRTMLACQLPDGMIPDAVYDEAVIADIDHPLRAEVTKPPIMAWAALKLDETDPDLDFLQEIYVPLVRWNAWWFSMNDDDADGLAQYNHPYSSGLDDSPLWDHGMPVESPDLNTYLCVQMGSLAIMTEMLVIYAESLML